MKLTLDIRPDLVSMMAAEIAAGERAVTAAMREAGTGLKLAWRGQIVGAGLGPRLANSIRSEVFPKAGVSLNAAALVWSKAPVIIGAHDAGPLIRSKSGFWLAIPTPAAGKALGGRRITPGGLGAEDRAAAAVRLPPDRSEPARRGRGRINARGLAAVSRSKTGRGQVTAPIFLLVIRGLFDNIGRLATYAATVAGIMAGRWVAGLVGAAVSVRGLATALVVLRGALIRTGIGAPIVAAGEMVYQFGRLVAGAGGLGEALSLLGDVAAEVWERIKLGGRSLALSLQIGLDHDRGRLADRALRHSEELGRLPACRDPRPRRRPRYGEHHAHLERGGDPGGLGFLRDLGRRRRGQRPADGLAASAAAAAGAATAPLASLQALRDAVKGSAEEAETALGGAAVAAGGFGGAVGKAGGASAAAAPEVEEAPEVAKAGWQLATDAVRDYAEKAKGPGRRLSGSSRRWQPQDS